MKKHFLLVTALLAAISMNSLFAQEPVLPEGMEILTPEGVVVTTNSERAYDKDKPITVAGSKEAGYKVYFTAEDAAHGEELWVSDGTKAGTKMVKDIYPGPNSSGVRYITRFNDKVVFQATGNDDDGSELWISDGTEGGTYMLLDINILGSSDPHGFTQLDESRFIFGAIDWESQLYDEAGAQHWLWISDGTPEGTQLLKDCQVIYPGSNINNDDAYHFVRVGRKVFFKGDTKDNEFGEELWITDGTEGGTFMLADINKNVVNEVTGATAGAQLDWFTNFKNEKLFFKAYSDEYGAEPFVSDGTPEGTHIIKDMYEGFNDNGLPRGNGAFTPRVYKDMVLFRGYHPTYGNELFRTDFTEAGTYMVADLNKTPTDTGTDNGAPDLFCEFDGVMFMKAQTGTDANLKDIYGCQCGLELIYTDGTEEGTKIPQSDLNPGTGNNAAWEGIVVSGSFYFRAQDKPPGGSQLWELFKIDHKDEFPIQVVDLGPGADFVHTLRNLNGDLIFTSQIIPQLFKYHYRKSNYDPEKDAGEMDPVFGPADIKKVKQDAISIGFYPNPAHETVNISSNTKVKGYTITDLSGRKIVSHTGSETVIPLSSYNLSKGVYVLTIANEKEELKAKLFIK